MDGQFTEWLRVAMALADAADTVTMHHFGSGGLPRRSKGDGSLVTQADLECENRLRGLHEAPSPLHLEKLVSASARFRCAWGWGNFWGHVQVAEGIVDAAFSFGTEIWDAAAPALVVEEAGGTWSDVSGVPSLASGTFLTSNGEVHAAVLSDLDMDHQRPT